MEEGQWLPHLRERSGDVGAHAGLHRVGRHTGEGSVRMWGRRNGYGKDSGSPLYIKYNNVVVSKHIRGPLGEQINIYIN